MIKTHLLGWSMILMLAISACSGETNQVPVSTSTLPSDPEPNLEPDPVPDPGGEYPTIIPTNSAKLPVTWASLNLSGKLVYSLGALDKNDYIAQIQVLDLRTGDVTVLYKAIPDAGIYYVSVSRDSRQIVMSYSPPPQSDPHIVQALYMMPVDISKPPELLFMPPTREDQYTQAEWSPDGKYIYYTHVNYIVTDPNRLYPSYTIFRLKDPGGQPELIAEEAYWPRLSSDSSRLVYVSADPATGAHQLKIADPDGRNAQDVVLSGPHMPYYKDAPFFSPDGKSIIFSGDVSGQSYQPNWFEEFAGILSVKAEGEALDWWSVPVKGGDITRLTNLQTAYLYGSLSPDKKHIVSYGGEELFIMKPDGSEVTELFSGTHRFYGTVNWIP